MKPRIEAFPHSLKSRNLVRFCRHPAHEALHESFIADFGFRAELSRFSVLKNYGTLPGPDECFSHIQIDARPLFQKLLGLDLQYTGVPDAVAQRLRLYNSLNYYRSHIEEFFTHSGPQLRPMPPVEGRCVTFFSGTDALVILYTLRNISRASVSLQTRWISRPDCGIEHAARSLGNGFEFGCVRKVASEYWARATLVGSVKGTRFHWKGKEFQSDWVEAEIPAESNLSWVFSVSFSANGEASAAAPLPRNSVVALDASIRRVEQCYAHLPKLKGEFRRFESLVLRAAGILLSNRYLDRDTKGRLAPTIHAGKCGVEATWWWDTSTHLMGLGLMGERKTAQGAVRLLLNGLAPDGKPPARYNNGGYCCDPQMPALAWGVSHLDHLCPDRAFLRKSYPGLARYVMWWVSQCDRDGNGLVEYPGDGCALDDALRWMEKFPIALQPGEKWYGQDWGEKRLDQFESPDVNAHLYLELRALERMSRTLGKMKDTTKWRRMAAALAAKINSELFDSKSGVYQDRCISDGRFTEYITLASFLPVYAGIAPKEVAQRMCRRYLLDPEHFYTTLPFSFVDRSHPAFRSGGTLYAPPENPGALVQQAYWVGRAWVHYSYWMVGALWQAGLRREADAAAWKILDELSRSESFYECYDPLTATGNGHAEFSWGAAPVLGLAYQWYKRGPLGGR